MGLADTVADALGQGAPTNADFPSSGTVPDSAPRAILARELAANPNDPNLRREVSLRFPDLLEQKSNPAAFSASVVEDALAHPPSAAEVKAGTPPSAGDRAMSGLKAAGEALLTPTKVAANQVTALGAQIAGGYEGGWALLKKLVGGGSLEDAVNAGAAAVRDRQARGIYQPGEGTPAAKVVEALGSSANPLNLPAVAGAKAGDLTFAATGSPAAAATVETAVNAVPLLLIKGGKGAAKAEPKVVGSGSIAEERSAPQVTAEPNYDVPTIIRRRAAQEVQPAPTQSPSAPPAIAPKETAPGRAATFDGPAEVKAAPTPEAAVKAAEESAPKFEDAAPAAEGASALSAGERAAREGVLQRVGLAGADVRKSAIEGDAKSAATDYQTSLLDNAAGNRMRAVLDSERQALTSHAENIVRETGGTLGTDAQSLEARGHAILSPLESFKQWFTDKTTGLYNEARTRAQGQPLALDKFADVLATDSKFQNSDTIALRNGIQARMRELGMMDKEGNLLPATVDQAEALRQYVNEEWSPRSNGRIRELKDALDQDVTSAAGEDVYKQARALHAMKQSIFADPKGLSSILDSEGINRKVPVEKIADTITALPNAQFAHIVKTLQTVPPELAPQAQAALAEIKAQFANRMRDAGASRVGQWGAKDVTAYLNKNAVKMRLVFSPKEMGAITDLNDAGHILAKPQGYPGAAVQAHNLLQRGVIGSLPKVGASAGATLGSLFGPVGTMAGAFVGDAAGTNAAARMGERAALKATEKRLTRLGQFPK